VYSSVLQSCLHILLYCSVFVYLVCLFTMFTLFTVFTLLCLLCLLQSYAVLYLMFTILFDSYVFFGLQSCLHILIYCSVFVYLACLFTMFTMFTVFTLLCLLCLMCLLRLLLLLLLSLMVVGLLL
jgi:hypothetical protein